MSAKGRHERGDQRQGIAELAAELGSDLSRGAGRSSPPSRAPAGSSPRRSPRRRKLRLVRPRLRHVLQRGEDGALDVPAATLAGARRGVASRPRARWRTARLRVSGADLAVAVTGIAGPGGGTPEKPVGTGLLRVGGARRRHGPKRATFPEIGQRFARRR